MNQDSLHTDAALPRLVKRPHNEAWNHVVQVRIFVHNARRVSAQFEHDLLLARAGFEAPAHRWRTGEAEQFQSFISGERFRVRAAARQDGKCAWRQVGFRQHFADHQRADGGEACGFEDEGTPCGNGGCDFVGGKIERKVEGCDEAAGADGNPLPHPLVAFGTG